jgi:hypothetical protein
MEISEIVKRIESALAASEQGQEAETNKFDFKLEWYNLKEKKGINEFIKDTSAVANTVGLDGLIVIGYDDSRKIYSDAKISQSGLRDISDFRNLIVKHVDYAFEINVLDLTLNGHLLSVIHIPPSLDKPHVIRNHLTNLDVSPKPNPNKIFVRKATGTYEATKADIELMFYDRKNIIPDYKLTTSVHLKSWNLECTGQHYTKPLIVHGISLDVVLTIENVGRRPVALTKGIFSVKINFGEDWTFESFISATPTIIKPNDIESVKFKLYYKQGGQVSMDDFSKMQIFLANTVFPNFNQDDCTMTFLTNKNQILESELVDTSD